MVKEEKKCRLLAGTASWTDPGFIADWYPKTIKADERLSWYSQRFNCVEINSSFYGIPDSRNFERWTRMTPDGFIFDVKLHKYLSHHSTKLKDLSPALRRFAQEKKGRVLYTPKLAEKVLDRFLDHLEPLVIKNKLGALLLQLSPGFGPRDHQINELEFLIKHLKNYSLAIELRNRSWLKPERAEETLDFFRERQVTLVTVDSPETEHFTAMPFSDEVTNKRLGYWRLHGRNEKGYVRGRTVAARFNYQYSKKEIQQTLQKVDQMAVDVTEMHVIYNNNASDYAPRAAASFLELAKKRAKNCEAVEPLIKGPRGKGNEWD